MVSSGVDLLVWIRRFVFAAVWLLLLYGVFVTTQAMLTVLANPPRDCIGEPVRNLWSPPPFIVWASLAAFIAGGLLGDVRQRHHRHQHEPERLNIATAHSHGVDRGPAAVLGVLVLALWLTVVLLGYETYAVASDSRQWPITQYVRCAYVLAEPATLIGSCLVLFLLGHWLWYAPRRARA